MRIKINSEGDVQMIYTEDVVNMSDFGEIKSIDRASHVEADKNNMWNADMSPSGGPVLGPFSKRSEALKAEVKWLNENILTVKS